MQGIKFINSPLGPILIGEKAGAIFTIHFLDEDGPIEDENPTELTVLAALQLEEYFNGQRTRFGFPISQPGTPFQQRVWAELLNIGCGQTISYLELARKLGDEKVIRAAASANGKNNLVIVVPCHRVIGSQGRLVGYAGGLWRKEWLLRHEAHISHRPTQGSLF